MVLDLEQVFNVGNLKKKKQDNLKRNVKCVIVKVILRHITNKVIEEQIKLKFLFVKIIFLVAHSTTLHDLGHILKIMMLHFLTCSINV